MVVWCGFFFLPLYSLYNEEQAWTSNLFSLCLQNARKQETKMDKTEQWNPFVNHIRNYELNRTKNTKSYTKNHMEKNTHTHTASCSTDSGQVTNNQTHFGCDWKLFFYFCYVYLIKCSRCLRASECVFGTKTISMPKSNCVSHLNFYCHRTGPHNSTNNNNNNGVAATENILIIIWLCFLFCRALL